MMLSTKSLQPILRKIESDNKDKFLWSILADFLEDSDDERAKGIRWLIENKKYPQFIQSQYGYVWWREGYETDRENSLEDSVFNLLWKRYRYDDVGASFENLSSALLAAAEAYLESLE